MRLQRTRCPGDREALIMGSWAPGGALSRLVVILKIQNYDKVNVVRAETRTRPDTRSRRSLSTRHIGGWLQSDNSKHVERCKCQFRTKDLRAQVHACNNRPRANRRVLRRMHSSLKSLQIQTCNTQCRDCNDRDRFGLHLPNNSLCRSGHRLRIRC